MHTLSYRLVNMQQQQVEQITLIDYAKSRGTDSPF